MAVIYHFLTDCEDPQSQRGLSMSIRGCVCIWIFLGEGCMLWMAVESGPVCPFSHSEFFCGLPHMCGHEPGCPPLDELAPPKVMNNDPPDHSFPCGSWELDPFHLFFVYLFGHSFMAALGLHCCPWAFSSCSGQASHCSGFSSCRAWALRCASSVAVALELSYPGGCEIFPDHGLNPCPLHWLAES